MVYGEAGKRGWGGELFNRASHKVRPGACAAKLSTRHGVRGMSGWEGEGGGGSLALLQLKSDVKSNRACE